MFHFTLRVRMGEKIYTYITSLLVERVDMHTVYVLYMYNKETYSRHKKTNSLLYNRLTFVYYCNLRV